MSFLKIHKFLLTGNQRTKTIKVNILGSLLIKGFSILTSLLLVPLAIGLLNQEKYGIWITIFTIVNWVSMMDIGIGNGFRNKFAEAIAKGDHEIAKKYIQTLYSSIGIIALSLLSVFSIINRYINWNTILNLPKEFDENIQLILLLVFMLFFIQLYIKNVSIVLLALQKTTVSDFLMLMGNIGALLLILVMAGLNQISLFSIAIAYMCAPIIVFLIASVILFNGKLKEYRPKIIMLPEIKYFKGIVSLGLKFFYIQMAMIVIFSSSNIIIIQLYGPAAVTPFNVTFRLFSSLQVFFLIIVTPFWSAFTEANAIKDFIWIKSSIKKLVLFWSIFSIGVLLLWLISPSVINLWVGKELVVSYGLALQFAIFTILLTWINIFNNYINGVGKIKLQVYITLFQFIIVIPLTIVLAKFFDMKTIGVILATNIILLVPAILMPIQYHKLITNTASGIWSK